MAQKGKPHGDSKGKGGKGNGAHVGGDGRSAADWAADYGWSLAFLKSHPDIEKIFNEAIKQTWSPQRFIAQLQDTKWFKHHADSARQAIYLQATDPATYNHRVDQIGDQIRNAAGALGIEVSDKTLSQWSKQALMFGWSDAQINNHLASQVDIMGKNSTVGGTLASTQDSLNQFAASNGVQINNNTMQSWLRAVVRGDSTFEEYKQYITKMAVAAHPNWAQELKGGMTMADIAEPYKQQMAQTLEMNPSDIQLDDPFLKKALTSKTQDGKYDSMTMYDFQDALRKDPRWMKTDNAKQSFMDTGSSILSMFGLTG